MTEILAITAEVGQRVEVNGIAREIAHKSIQNGGEKRQVAYVVLSFNDRFNPIFFTVSGDIKIELRD